MNNTYMNRDAELWRLASSGDPAAEEALIEEYSRLKFRTYPEFCIRRRLYSAIKSASRFKHIPLNDYVSLESPEIDESNAQGLFHLRDPEEFVIARERVDEITDSLHGSLSRFESKVLGLYLEGLSYEEMAVKLKKTPKSVDNAVQRIRKKLAQLLKNGDNQ